MKKNMVSKSIISLSVLLSLSACSGKQPSATASSNVAQTSAISTAAGASTSTKSSDAKTSATSTSSKGTSLNAVYDKMIADVKFPTEMLRMDDEYLEMQFGFTPDDFDEWIYAQGEDPLLAETVILIKTKEGVSADSVKTKFEEFISDQTTLLNDYVPDQGKVAAKSIVYTTGDYVCLLMSSQVAALKKIATEMIK